MKEEPRTCSSTGTDAGHPGAWLVLHKKGGQTTALTYAETLGEALCFGWIDGQIARREDDSSRIPANQVVLLRDREAQAISAAAGVPVPALHARTIARYHQRAIVIDHASGWVSLRAM